MGKHTPGGASGVPGGEGRRRGSDGGKRRVPAERRRTPGERTTSAGARGGADSYQLEDAASRRRGSLEAAPARLRMERDRRRAGAKRIAAIVVAVVVVLLVVAGGGVFAYAQHIQKTMQSTIVKQQKLNPALKPAEPMKPFTLLLLGADHRKGETAYRTDTIIFAKIDPQQKKVWLLSIPRDTQVLIPKHGYDKINASHALGGPELTIKTVEEFTGVPINHYVEVNFQGFQGAVDALGGVWVNVPHAINDKKAASQSVHQRAAKIPAGYQLLDGEHALTFVRTRDFADADISRMKDQQIFFKAVADQMAKSTDAHQAHSRDQRGCPLHPDRHVAHADDQDGRRAQGRRLGQHVHRHDRRRMEEPLHLHQCDVEEEAARRRQGGSQLRADPVRPRIVHGGRQEEGRCERRSEEAGSDPGDRPQRRRDLGYRQAGRSDPQGERLHRSARPGTPTRASTRRRSWSTRPTGRQPSRSRLRSCRGSSIVESRGMYSYPTEILVVVGKDWDASKIPVAQVLTN